MGEDDNGSSNPKKQRARTEKNQPRWSTTEQLVLVAAKRTEFDQATDNSSRDRMKTAEAKWADISAACKADGVNREGSHCKKRWEKLMTDFKKIYDYQKAIGTGQTAGYFELSSQAKKEAKTPVNFAHEVYEAMVLFVPKQKAISPHPNQVIDSTPDEEDNNNQEEIEDQVPTYTPTEPIYYHDLDGNQVDGPIEVEPEMEEVQNNPPPPGSNEASQSELDSTARGWKRKRLSKSTSDDGLLQVTKGFHELIAADCIRRNLHDEHYLAFEKKKWDEHHALELQKHEEATLSRNNTANALLDVGASIRFFAMEMNKK